MFWRLVLGTLPDCVRSQRNPNDKPGKTACQGLVRPWQDELEQVVEPAARATQLLASCHEAESDDDADRPDFSFHSHGCRQLPPKACGSNLGSARGAPHGKCSVR